MPYIGQLVTAGASVSVRSLSDHRRWPCDSTRAAVPTPLATPVTPTFTRSVHVMYALYII